MSNFGPYPGDVTAMDDATATRLGLKSYHHGTTYNGGNSPTITLAGGGGVLVAVEICELLPYQLQDGSWRLKGNVVVELDLQSRTLVRLSIAGVVFKTNPNGGQSCSGDANTTAGLNRINVGSGSGLVSVEFDSVLNAGGRFSFDAALDSKPNWAY